MLEKDLATIIVPIYNGERFLQRFLDSLYGQTYTNLQIILVDDGSTDSTKQIIERNRNRFVKKFYSYEYLYQENGGAAKACCTALQYVKGEFLSWADCDDCLYSENIKKKVEFLQKHRDCSLVVCQAEEIDFDTNKRLGVLAIDKRQQNNDIFWTILNGIPCYPGVFTIVSQKLFDIFPSRKIPYDSECGQNYQLLLPVAYHNKCGYIDECLYKYFVRKDSHSHNSDYCREFARSYIIEQILEQTLLFINKERTVEYRHVMDTVHKKFIKRRLSLSFDAIDVQCFNASFSEAKKANLVSTKLRIIKLIINHRNLYNIYLKYKVMKQTLKDIKFRKRSIE